ncbi:hypothetical protein [Arthrobacter roseus]|uniref:hypothetical protein n=1 Tax=Arthrobacter roseus TaxID=136274 RepID=UPI001965B73C|nr:hypothetical protein [Arthrobacter roseus]MBM7848470.1 hypothetical protein [Arthrobacter roseus]
MRITVDTKTTTVYTGTKPEISPAVAFVDNQRQEQQPTDKITGLLLWTAVIELVMGEDAMQGQKIKIASATEPKLSPRTEYTIDGNFYATPYVTSGGKKAEVSFLLVGTLKEASVTSPLAKSN